MKVSPWITDHDTYMEMGSFKGIYGNTVNLQATLKDTVTKNPISGGEITFYINKIALGKGITNDQGIATYAYTLNKYPDIYTITASYTGGVYNPSTVDSMLTIDKMSYSVTCGDTTCKMGDTVHLTGHLVNSMTQKPVAGSVLVFRRMDGSLLGTGKTNENGDAVCNYKVIEAPGKYNFVVQVDEKDISKPDAHWFGVTVEKSDANLVLNDMKCTRGKLGTFKAKLTDSRTGQPIQNQNVEFYLRDIKVGESLTNNDGDVTFARIFDEVGGDYKISAKYGGNAYYNPIEANGALHLYNYKTDLFIPNIPSQLPGATFIVSATLTKDLTGMGLVDMPVDFYLSDKVGLLDGIMNGSVYAPEALKDGYVGTVRTDKSGVATIKYVAPPTPGRYIVAAHFSAVLDQYACSDYGVYVDVGSVFQSNSISILNKPPQSINRQLINYLSLFKHESWL